MKNKKRLLSVLTLFMCVALVSIGFAAWVITGDATEKANGNVNVTEVSDERLTITDIHLTPDTIVFGKNSAETTNHWLKADGVENEVLTTTLTFTVGNNKQCTGVDLVLAPTTDTADAYNAAVEAKYIVSPTTEVHLNKASDELDGTGKYTATFTWTWGTEFSLDGKTTGKNPFEFYNGLTGAGNEISEARTKDGRSNADYAKTALEGLYKLLNVKFTISIHAVSTANQA